jgi:hypothetical protein
VDANLAEFETRFRRAGLPLFIEDYSATEDIFNRSVPLLGLVFIGEFLLAVDKNWRWWENGLALAGGMAILLFAVGLLNRVRGRKWRAVPERVGKSELAAFVLVPAIIPLVFGGQLRQAVLTIVANLFILGLVYLIVGYALLSTLRWAAVRVIGELAGSVAILARAVPLLLIVVLLLVLTQETWLTLAELPVAFVILVSGLFAVTTAMFLTARLPGEVRELERELGTDAPPLRRRQRLNVGVVLFVSQVEQVAVVSLGVFVFFVLFGVLTLPEATQMIFLNGHDVEVILRFTLFDRELVVTRELLRVSIGLAAFSGLYYAIAVLNDPAYRKEFLDDLTREMRDTFRLRGEYLARRRSVAGIDLRAFLPPQDTAKR